jgi:hypothetical protein
MKKITADKALPVIKVVQYLEKIINRRRLDKAFHRDEVEKHFTYLLQGKNMVDPYERRDAGIGDEEWEAALKEMYQFLGLTGDTSGHEKLFDT